MRNFLFTLSLAGLISCHTYAQDKSYGYPISQVPFTSVKITNNTFWGQRIQASRDVTIPLAFKKCEEEHRYKNFEQAAEKIKDPTKDFKVTMGFSFDDTDPYKTLEGASYLMQTFPNTNINGTPIKQYCDSVIAIIASAQEKDGYLYTARTQNPEHPHNWAGKKRWERVEDLSHEFYNLGHLCEAAVAHFNATKKTTLLTIAQKYADCICKEVGEKDGQACVVPGHQIAEMGLAKLYIATGDKKYLQQAKFFLDKRGVLNNSWQKIRNGYTDNSGYYHRLDQYSQSHKPVLEQDEAVGHAVRAGYMYAGMADVAALTQDKGYINAIDKIWENIVGKKYYITGGVGATSNGEAFGANYELPNMTAYCETCAAIAQVYMNYRLFLLHGESKYMDVLERTLYNGVLSGISIDGGKFFYPNPLQSKGQHERQAWFGCACCPSNASRFIPSFPQYIYAVNGKNLYINLFAGNEMTTTVNGKKITLKQTTNYPWDGNVSVSLEKANAQFAINIRIPGWIKNQVVPSDLYYYSDGKKLNYSITVNGEQAEGKMQNGYFTIERKWKKGDQIDIHFDMEPRVVKANNLVKEDNGRVCIERGPLVYCAEWADNKCDIQNILISQRPVFELGKTEICNTEITTIKTDVQSFIYDKNGKVKTLDETLTLIPYYAWAHRGKGNMAVWLANTLSNITEVK